MGKIEELEKYVETLQPVYQFDKFSRGRVWADKSSLLYFVGEIKKQLKSSLPTQQDKVVVPQCVDRFLSVGNKSQKLACLVSCKYSILTCDMAEGEVKQWLREVSMDDLLSLANGYTVEKEQLYLIKCAEDRSSDDVYLEEALWRTKNRARAECKRWLVVFMKQYGIRQRNNALR